VLTQWKRPQYINNTREMKLGLVEPN